LDLADDAGLDEPKKEGLEESGRLKQLLKSYQKVLKMIELCILLPEIVRMHGSTIYSLWSKADTSKIAMHFCDWNCLAY